MSPHDALFCGFWIEQGEPIIVKIKIDLLELLEGLRAESIHSTINTACMLRLRFRQSLAEKSVLGIALRVLDLLLYSGLG